MEERRMRKVASKKNCERGSSKWLEAMTRVNGGNLLSQKGKSFVERYTYLSPFLPSLICRDLRGYSRDTYKG